MFPVTEVNKEVPDAEFEIEHAYGYRASDCQQNLYYTAEGKAVYMVAALGVVMDTNTCEQAFYGGQRTEMVPKMENGASDISFHRDDILSLDISSDRKTVVTGESGKCPAVHVWSTETREKVTQFALDKMARGVACVSISPCQRYVATADLSNEHRVTIYNIARGKQLLQMNGSADRINEIAWSKRADDLRFMSVSPK